MNTYSGSSFPPIPADKAASYYYRLRRHAQSAPKPTTELTVEAIGSTDNLAAVYEIMKRQNGSAPGPDGISYPELGRRELYNVLRPLSKSIRTGTYRPGPARHVRIPKGGDRGHRTLTIRNLIDRVVARALAEALTPYWEGIFSDCSHGYRPGRSHLTLLAALERVMVRQGRWVLVIDDIQNAFDHVPIDAVLEHHRGLSNKMIFNRLVEVVVRGGDADRKIGVDQGCPFSPLAMNVLLHHVCDAHAPGANPGNPTPRLRYADNVVMAARDVPEGRPALLQLSTRLRTAGLALKGENGGEPVNLTQGKSAQVLGFTLFKRGNRLGIKLSPDAWKSLGESLTKAHETDHPHAAAQAAVRGWIASHGPAFLKRQDRTVSHLLRLASTLGLRELYSSEFLLEECRRAHQRWTSLVRQDPTIGGKGETIGGSASHCRPRGS